jgi:hypothetical protein
VGVTVRKGERRVNLLLVPQSLSCKSRAYIMPSLSKREREGELPLPVQYIPLPWQRERRAHAIADEHGGSSSSDGHRQESQWK